MHINDPSALVNTLCVFLLGLWTLLSGQKAKERERQHQAIVDAEEAERKSRTEAAAKVESEAKEREQQQQREDDVKNALISQWQGEAELWRGQAELWRKRAGEIQARLDSLQELHDRMLSEWIEAGTTRAEQLAIVRASFQKQKQSG